MGTGTRKNSWRKSTGTARDKEVDERSRRRRKGELAREIDRREMGERVENKPLP